MAELSGPKRVRLLVCGEQLRGDDAAAILAVELLPPQIRSLAEIQEVGQLGVEALLDVPDGVALVVADAAVGVAGGTVVTLPLEGVARSPGSGATPASSHSLPPDQVLAFAAELRGAMPRGVFVGIGGAEFGFGEGLSTAVAAGLPAFAGAIAEAIRNLAADLP